MGEAKKRVLVTGGNRGLGLGTVEALARLGHEVMLASRERGAGEAAAAALRGHGLAVVSCVLDVASAESITALRAQVERQWGGLDVLVNNAGIFADRDAEGGESVFTAPVESLRAAMETNLYGPLLLCQAFVPGMQARGYGRVVNVSTGMAQLSDMNGGYPAYRTSKTALNALTRIVHDEVKGHGVLVNSVCPGWVRTDMGGAAAPRSLEQGVSGIVWAATLPASGPSGGFFRDGKAIPW